MLQVEYIETIRRPAFGGFHIESKFAVNHRKNGRSNDYIVTCETRCFETGQPVMDAESAVFVGNMETDSNDETLIEEAVLDLFQEWLDR